MRERTMRDFDWSTSAPARRWPRVRLIPLLSGIATAGVLHAQPATAAHPDLQRFTDSVAMAMLQSRSVPGVSVVVTRGADVLIAKGYGLANRDTRTAATPRTVYQLGSISKQFTAAAVMRLAEKGMLRLDDAVSRHLPEYRPQGDSVRLSHLLHQTSGIREEFMLPRYGELIGDTTRPNAELMALIEREPLGFAPGSRWSYSNSNYALLAAILERVTGKPYERVLADEFFEPLRLTSLQWCSDVRRSGSKNSSARTRSYGFPVTRSRIAARSA